LCCALSYPPHHVHMVSCPYRTTIDIHQLINSDVENFRPSRELAETLLEEDMWEISEDMEELIKKEEEEEEEEKEESAIQYSSTQGSH